MGNSSRNCIRLKQVQQGMGDDVLDLVQGIEEVSVTKKHEGYVNPGIHHSCKNHQTPLSPFNIAGLAL